eukprot:TRINITY_DN11784_c0_g1_i1.p1 TRINITY_DN11784_c0_g1~~TRINITY_DN11784_c0_g1_i1.p1  ORF type:complete len:449 (-),score=73.02 TRINITY_DN11784_c0_g1_i1:27-1373(-)
MMGKVLLILLVGLICLVPVSLQQEQGSHKYHWFHQVTDHFDTTNLHTFRQRYWIQDDQVKKEGPVFIFLGGEAPIQFFDFQQVSALAWAEQFGATYIALEHRYYGESTPPSGFLNSNMKYLSSQQALADAAHFIESISMEHGLENRKWVVLGCSYSGSLSAWFRTKYPNLVVASIAPSGPVYAVSDYSKFMNHFSDVAGKDCLESIRTAVEQIEKMLLTTDGRRQLSSAFNACEILQPNKDDIFLFKWQISDTMASTAQWENPPGWALTNACKNMTDPTQNLISSWGYIYGQSMDSFKGCNSFNARKYIQSLKNTDGGSGRAWFWQKCTEFGWFQGANYSSAFFDQIPYSNILNWCSDVFDIDHMVPHTQWTNTYYGSKQIGGSNILFTNGLFDPWHTLSIIKSDSNVEAVTYEAAHCAPMTQPTSQDPASLVEARKRVVSFLNKVLK